jgi:drug/metabolite transporter (DMT)-like permease
MADIASSNTSTQPSARLGVGAAALGILMWAAGIIMVRPIPMSGVQVAFWRVLLGAIVYWVALLISGRRLTWRQLRITAPAAVAIGLEIAVFFVALKSTTVANAVVISALQPIVLMGVAARRFGEQVTRWLVQVAIVATAGVALVAFGSSSQPVWSPRGDLLAIVAMFMFSAYFAFSKAAREHVPAFEFQTAIWLIGSVALLPVALVEGGGSLTVPTGSNLLWLVALLAVPGSGHLLVNWAHARVPLMVISMLTLANPVLSSVGAAAFLDEPLDVLQIVGIAVVLGALAVTVRREAELHRRTRLDATPSLDPPP